MASLYLHIPFCQSRCIYCDFYSTTSINRQADYIEALIREMSYAKELAGENKSSGEWNKALRAHTLSIYIGGGTPSTLPINLLQKLLEKTIEFFPPKEGVEITVEANPDDVNEAWVKGLRKTLANRVSMGVQTFHDPLLQFLHRRHNAQEAIDAVHRLQDAGFENLSIDLIYGLPGQTLKMWEEDINQALQLNVPHLSAYTLMYEEGTPITRMLEQGKLKEMDEEISLKCYQLLCDKLEAAGYEHYEISNFARPDWYSRHNSAYWTGDAYLGFGAGAHSYDGEKTRRWNRPSLQAYINDPLHCYEEEHLTETDLYNEFIMTRLRTAKGFCIEELAKRFGSERLQYCKKMMHPHLQSGNLVQTGTQVHLSRAGIFVSNDIMSDLFISDK